MKRSPFLQPLSREHHAALTLARACERAGHSDNPDQVAAACARALREYAQQLAAHFELEERSLLPLLHGDAQALVLRTLADHRALHGLLDRLRQNDAAALACFGETLAAHVRFEERELFPAIERVL